MNIFYLDHDVKKCAALHCDKHVVKMVLETAQLLSTAHWELGGEGIYRPTHKNHPCAKWVREAFDNYVWAFDLFEALANEYTDRYGKTHLSWFKGQDALCVAPEGIPMKNFSQPPQCMPEEYKVPGDSIAAYKRYYKFKAETIDFRIRGEIIVP